MLGGGAKTQIVGANMQEVSFKETQGQGEVRIALAAGVPPPILGLTAEQAPYSAYPFARRRMADLTMRPLWRNMAASLSTIIPVPPSAELWYDDRDIAFLKEDVKAAAEVQKLQAETLKALTEAGYVPDSAMDSVIAGDFGRLKHSGLQSVQLLPPGTTFSGGPNGPNQNGSGLQPGQNQKQLPPAGGTQQGRELLAGLLPD